MKKILILMVAMLFIAGSVYAASIVGSAHDITGYIGDEVSTEVCVYCHTPHQTAAAGQQDPLWNHTQTATAAFTTYASSTLNATPIDIGGTGAVSLLCMSCHDGTVAVNSVYNVPQSGNLGTLASITGTALLGTDLSDDHPVNFTYDAALVTADQGTAATPGLNDPTVAAIADLLFATRVQCASCHDVHDPQFTPFLTQDNSGSALCLLCHAK